jgi:hypothetical protein
MAGKPKGLRPALIGSAKPEEGKRAHNQVKFIDNRIPYHLPQLELNNNIKKKLNR